MPVRFSVVVATHNRRETLLVALQSALQQTRAAEQVLVVADGCTDGSVEAVRALGDARIEVLDLPKAHRKGWIHRNEALRRARGDVIAYLGDDDLWMPDHLERVGELFDAGDVDLVQATAFLVWPDGRLELFRLDWRVPLARERFLQGVEHKTPFSALCHRAGLAEEAGGWAEDPPGAGDEDLFRRMALLRPRIAHLTEPTVLIVQARRGVRERRVEQSRECLRRVSDPAERARLRAELSYAIHEHEYVPERQLFELRDEHAALHERYGALHERHAALENERSALQGKIASLEPELARLRERSATLDRVVAGGWWRLRGRLLPLLRLAARVGRVRRPRMNARPHTQKPARARRTD